MIYQHPLAYLLGLQGVALLRAFNGEYDREFTEARIEFGEGATTPPITATQGYAAWAQDYDGPNDLMVFEEPIMRPIIDRRPTGPTLDAACGTGRHTAYLASKGHSVIGVDGSAQMLAKAKAKVPGVDFRLGDLRALPVTSGEVDLVTVSLALSIVQALPDGSYGYLPHYRMVPSGVLRRRQRQPHADLLGFRAVLAQAQLGTCSRSSGQAVLEYFRVSLPPV